MKSKSLSSALHLILTSSLPSITHCYILNPGCAPYIDDIRRGPQDYQYSMQAAQAALAPQEATNSHNVILDWTGLLTPLFPGLTGTRDTTLHDSLVTLSSFDQTAYHSIDNAIETAWNPLLENVSTPLLPDRRYLDSTTLFVCDPTTFIKDVIAVEDPGSEDEPGGTDEYIHIWYDTATDEIYRDLTFDEELCPPGVPTRLAYHQGRGFGQADDEEDYPDYYIVVLCLEILTQTPGKPKMWATLDGQELSNTRPSDGTLPNELAYVGMSIDDLRSRVLSVHLARNLLIIMAQKWDLDILPRNGYDTYARCATMNLEQAKGNMDSLSLFITGARLYYNYLNPQMDPAFLTISRWIGGVLTIQSPTAVFDRTDLGINY